MAPKKIRSHTTKQARAAARARLGPLAGLTVQNATRVRYDKALRSFFQYLKLNEIVLPSSHFRLDELLSTFVEHLWQEGEPKSFAADTLSAMQDKLPHVRGHLPQSWRLLKTWSKHELPVRSPPLLPELVNAMSGFFISQNQGALALGIQVAFYCWLRTGELLSVQAKHVSVRPGKPIAVINLCETKVSGRRAMSEAVTLSQPHLVKQLTAWKSAVLSNSFLIPISAHAFRAAFREALTFCGLPQTFKPYSLRRGGATHAFKMTGSYSHVCQAGRWASERTARIYISDSVAASVEITSKVTSKALRIQNLFWERVLERRCYECP